jgi:hypothetical protein
VIALGQDLLHGLLRQALPRPARPLKSLSQASRTAECAFAGNNRGHRPKMADMVRSAIDRITPKRVLRELIPLTKDPSIAVRDPLDPSAYRRSAQYVAHRMSAVGLQPNGDPTKNGSGRRTWYESFFWESRFGPRVTTQSWNVRGVLRGKPRADGQPNTVIKVVSHLDNLSSQEKLDYFRRDQRDLSRYEGANDNASAVAANLEIARALVQGGPLEGVDVEFEVYSAEEDGLKGSEAQARRLAGSPELKRLTAVVNFEMIGFEQLLLYGGSTQAEAETNPLYQRFESIAAKTPGLKLKPGTLLDAGERWWSRSDHLPFAQLGVRTVMILGNPAKGRYHTDDDRLENVNPERVAQAARLAAQAIRELAADPTAAERTEERPATSGVATPYSGRTELGSKRPAWAQANAASRS